MLEASNLPISKSAAFCSLYEKQDFSGSPIHSLAGSSTSYLSDTSSGDHSKYNILSDTTPPFRDITKDDDSTDNEAGYQSDFEDNSDSFDAVAHIKGKLSRAKSSRNSRRALEIIEQRKRQLDSDKYRSRLPVLTITPVQNVAPLKNCLRDFEFDESQDQYKSEVNDTPSPTVSALVRATVEIRSDNTQNIWPHHSRTEELDNTNLDIPLLSGLNINSYTESLGYSSAFLTSTPIFSIKIGSIRSFEDNVSFCGLNDPASISPNDFTIAKELKPSATLDLLVDISLDTPQFHTCASFMDSPAIMANDESCSLAACDQSRILVGLGLGPIAEVSVNSSSSITQLCEEGLIPKSPLPEVGNENESLGYLAQVQAPVPNNYFEAEVFPSEIDPIGGLSATTNAADDKHTKPTSPSSSFQHHEESVLEIVAKRPSSSHHLKSPPSIFNTRVRDTKLIKERIERSAALQDKNSRLKHTYPVQKQPHRDNLSTSPFPIVANLALSSVSAEEIDLLQKLGLYAFKLSPDNDPRSPNISTTEQLLDCPEHSWIASCCPKVDYDKVTPALEEVIPAHPALHSSLSQQGKLAADSGLEGIGIGLPSDITSRTSDLSTTYSWDEISPENVPSADECHNLAQLASLSSPNCESGLSVNRAPLKRQVRAPLKKMQFLKISKFAKRRLSTIPEYPTTPSPKVSPKNQKSPTTPGSEASDSNSFQLTPKHLSFWSTSRRCILTFLRIYKKTGSPINTPNSTTRTEIDLTCTTPPQPVPNNNGSPGVIENPHIPRGLGIFKRGDPLPLVSNKPNRRPKSSPWRLNLLF